MMLAWFSSSENTTSSGPTSAGIVPTLAWKPVGNTSASSAPLSAAMRSSSRRCRSRLPVTSRDAPAPAPYASSAARAPAITRGSPARPR